MFFLSGRRGREVVLRPMLLLLGLTGLFASFGSGCGLTDDLGSEPEAPDGFIPGAGGVGGAVPEEPGRGGGAHAAGGGAAGEGGVGGERNESCPPGYAGDLSVGCAPLLLALDVSQGVLEPPFVGDATEYRISVPLNVGVITLTPHVVEGATVLIRGARVRAGESWTSAPLRLGNDVVVLAVEQEGHPSTIYTLSVARGSRVTYLSSSDAGQSNAESVALSGDGRTLAWGNPGESRVHVLEDRGGDWIEVVVWGSPARGYSKFGASVALSKDGSWLAVGAPGEENGPDPWGSPTQESGAVYLFTRRGAEWERVMRLRGAQPIAGDRFGFALGLSDAAEILVVGAPGEVRAFELCEGCSFPGRGGAYVFERSATGWTQKTRLVAESEGEDYFGWSVSLSGRGDVVAVGAPYESSGASGIDGDPTMGGGLYLTGAVYLFGLSGNDWRRRAYVKASVPHNYGLFGYSVALAADAETLAVGATYNGFRPVREDACFAYLFRLREHWSQEGCLRSLWQSDDKVAGVGESVALSSSGDLLAMTAIEAPLDEGLSSEDSGAWRAVTYLSSRIDSVWGEPVRWQAREPMSFGTRSSVSLSDDGAILVGVAYGDGAPYVMH